MQHVAGPTHLKGHTLDLVFSNGLNVENLHVEESLVSVDSFISLFDAEPSSNNDDDDDDDEEDDDREENNDNNNIFKFKFLSFGT